MTDRIPIKANFSGADPISLAEFQTGDTVPEAQGGTGTTVGVKGFKNKLINGCLRTWQRATSISATGFSADRWIHGVVGSTLAGSRQAFTLGQTDVPGNPLYYVRTVVTSVAGANNYITFIQYIEGVAALSGKTVTLSFWAKADAAKQIAIEFVQRFGTGGSPSADVLSIGITKHNLTTAWQKFTTTVTLPSVSGKTLGSNVNDSCGVLFWFDSGSNFNARSGTLGQQSGTFDIAQVQLEEGPTATAFEERPLLVEQTLCFRYYQKSFSLNVAPAQNLGASGACADLQVVGAGAGGLFYARLPVPLRSVGSCTLYNPSAANALARNEARANDCPATTAYVETPQLLVIVYTTSAGSVAGDKNRVHWAVDAEL